MRPDKVEEILLEMIQLIDVMRKKQATFYVVQNFWSLQVFGKTMQQYLYEQQNIDKQLVIIMAIMDSGPYFEWIEDLDRYPKLFCSPEIQNRSFEYPFLYTCYLEQQKLIISHKEPYFLVNEQYDVFVDGQSFSVQNLLGVEGVLQYYDECSPLMSIADVFEKVENEFLDIVILPSAKKSAARHHFKSQFAEVYSVLMNLHHLVLDDKQAMTEQNFYERTGFKISDESDATLQVRRLRQEGEFVIPGLGKKLFSWHIKIGNEIRIHYYIDRSNNKIYIGHCGAHLGTVSYNS